APTTVADASTGTQPTSAANAGQVAKSNVAGAPCDGADPTSPCFQQVPEPLRTPPDSAANDHGTPPQDVAGDLRRAWQYRAGTASEQGDAVALYPRLVEDG